MGLQITERINRLVFLPLYLYLYIMDKNAFHSEIKHWYDILPFNPTLGGGMLDKGITLLSSLPEFRSILYYRLKLWKYNPIKLFYPPLKSLYIPYSQKIGEGLVVQHGFSTIFNCESMGENCQVWHGVTIGKAKSGRTQKRPVIGNNVKICAHAIVLGDIEIGDNVTIGAGSVVTKSIPANSIVVGNPARIIKVKDNSDDRNVF